MTEQERRASSPQEAHGRLDLGILVGVTGRHENTNALKVGIQAARSRACPITLVHVGHLAAPSPVNRRDAWDQGSDAAVIEVREEVEALSNGSVSVGTAVRHGDPGLALGRLTSAARLLVLQHRDLSPVHRVVTGSTVTAAAAHASCPVVAVPSSLAVREHGLVVVGLHDDGGPTKVLESAFQEADRRSSTLMMFHACPIIPGYEAVSGRRAGWRMTSEHHLEAAVSGVMSRHPSVRTRTLVSRRWPDEVLLELSSRADLLVVGRHGHHGPPSFRLGSLARVAVQWAACPVMVVPI